MAKPTVERIIAIETVVQVAAICDTCAYFARGTYDSECCRFPKTESKRKEHRCGEWKAK